MNYSLLYALILFLLPPGLCSQDISSHYRSVEECMQQYEILLQQIHEIQRSPETNDIKIAKLHNLLCQQPGPLFPLGNLYIEGSVECNSAKLNPMYRISPDCTRKEFAQPLVEYFIQYIHKNTRVPQISKFDIIFDDGNKVFVRYQSEGETIEECYSSNKSRIAIINVSKEDLFINQLRWATTQENLAVSLHSFDEQPQIVQQSRPTNNRVQELTQQINILENSISAALNRLSEAERNYRIEISKSDSLEHLLKDSELQQKATSELNSDQKEQLGVLSKKLDESKSTSEQYKHRFIYIRDSLRVNINKKLNTLDQQVGDLGQYYLSSLNAYDQYNYNKTLFVGLGYGLIQAPFNIDPNSLRSQDPIRKSFHSEDALRNFDLSVYHIIGLSLSNLRINPKRQFNNIYSSIQADEFREELFLSGKHFDDIHYISSDHDITSFNLGFTIYTHSLLDIFFLSKNKIKDIPIINSLYIKFGIAYLKGSVWDYYDGNYINYMTRDPSSGYYILDHHDVSTTDFFFGLSYVKPFFQFDLGYNRLYGDFYLNLGINYPIKDVRSPFSIKTIGPHDDKRAEELRTKIKNMQKLVNKDIDDVN